MTTSTWCFVWSFARASTKAAEVSLLFAVHLSTAGWRKMERCQMSKVPAFLLQLYDPRKHWKTSTDTTAMWHHIMMVCTQTMVTVYHIIICKGFCATREFVQKESRQLLTFQQLSCASHHVQHLPLKTHANPEHGYIRIRANFLQFSTGCWASWPQETCTKLSWDACQTAKAQISGAGRSKRSNVSKRSCIKVAKIESRSVKVFI